MKARLVFLAGVLLLTIGAAPATQPGADNGWDASAFGYHRPAHMVIEQTTPTAEQVSFLHRPAQMPANAPAPKDTGPAKPRVVGPADVIRLEFTDSDGQVVPVLLCTPKGKKGPFPLVIATHGLTSDKAQVCGQVAPALVAKGFAVMAADMPEHGERAGNPLDQNPLTIFKLFQEAVIDVRQEIDVAEQLPQVTTKRGVVLVGYSMGSWISAQAAPADGRVRAVVLMVGGIEPEHFPIEKGPNGAERDPSKSLQHFTGKPVLMLNGTRDHLVPADTAMALFGALPEPKRQFWYNSDHLLPRRAYKDAADWIAKLTEPATEP